MPKILQDGIQKARQALKFGLDFSHAETGFSLHGTFIFEMRDAKTGEVLSSFEKKNLIVKDAGILMASLVKGDAVNPSGLTMLAVGTGATGNLLSPDAPQLGQRKLNNEIARKAFSSKQYRNADGVAVSYRTNIVDFTATFGEAEAVGPLNEMGLMSAASANTAVRNQINNGPSGYNASLDVAGKDLLINYLPFGVVAKPSTAVISITWRLSF